MEGDCQVILPPSHSCRDDRPADLAVHSGPRQFARDCEDAGGECFDDDAASLDLLYTGVEDDLRSAVRDLLVDQCDPAAVIALYDGDRSIVGPLWNALSIDLGLGGLLIPEKRGGAGGSAREAAVVLEELGRFAAPVPFLTSAVVATTALLGSDADLLDTLASGERTATLAVPFSTAPHSPLGRTVTDSAGALTGTITSVAGALEADTILVPVAGIDGLSLYAVDVAAVRVQPVVSLDMTRQLADIHLDGQRGNLVLGPLDDAHARVRRALLVGAALLASEQFGIARWCLDTTVTYVKDRHQFGRQIGSFQAIKHRLADLFTTVESAAAIARYAAAALAAQGDDQVVAGTVAQAYCSDLAVTAAEEAVQLHAGIGMTWEHPAHLYLKRAKADQIAFGTAADHRVQLGHLVNLEL
jgi:alkylation response protein AidB-like acyl-CoA dehydrogenase